MGAKAVIVIVGFMITVYSSATDYNSLCYESKRSHELKIPCTRDVQVLLPFHISNTYNKT